MRRDREEAERRRIEMARKEQDIRESKDFMAYIRNTEEKINDIVERGQNNMQRKASSERDGHEVRKRQEYEARLRRNIEERER